ncbi:rod shape-determining protein MreD [Evansella sp. AB-P1]|uniref:rod shape-determining protein MreD n=1 Tax=Evansella sp. AB-P1 TaxID=3037653 RepID=UPI00241F06C6|nr:rod shape-determining protein MreD [Evansella sp. AB-P1]MDG5786850.1 rod shape-determining protein MreD [Evansella sp. AB-P1]
MIRYVLFLILFLLFILEGSVFQIFAPDQFGVPYLFTPRWVFLIIIFAGIFRGRMVGTVYGIIFGVMYDVIYMSVLGVYAFGMGFIAYLLSISIPIFQRNLIIAIITAVLAVITLDYYVYGMMLLLGITTVEHAEFFNVRFLPSLLLNVAFISVFAYPLRKGFYYLRQKQEEEKKL